MTDPIRTHVATEETLQLVAEALGASSGLSPTSPLDSPMRAIAVELARHTALLGVLANTTATAAMMADHDELATAIADGIGPQVAPVATRMTWPWSTKASSAAEADSYSAPVNVVHHGQGALADGETLPVMHAQFHRVLPFDTQFDAYQAFLHAIDGLPAGVYNVTMPSTYVNATMQGKTYQFELESALPAGGVLSGFRECSGTYAASMLNVYAHSSQASDATVTTIAATEGDGGTSLGTFSVEGVAVPLSGTPASMLTLTIDGTDYRCYGLNSIHRVAYGSNRWAHSPLRKYLNSYGFGWYEPATVFSLPPAYKDRQGFMSGLPESLLAHVQPIARKTALNYITDGGTSAAPEYDTTYDYFTLPSGKEHFLQATNTYGGADGLEGEAWEYWERVAGSSVPLGWSTWNNEATYHPEYIQYDMASPTTARLAWMRSATRGYGNTVAIVSASGPCSNSYAITGGRCAPACAIG